MTEAKEEEKKPFTSKLTQGWQRFLAHVIEHGFEVGRRDPTDFIRHFPPSAIMEGLKDRPTLRANILVICTGTRMKIALKKSAGSCAEDLQIALDEDEADAETVVALFDPDDRVRYLDKQKLWQYVTEGEFWKSGAKDPKVAAQHVAYILERALEDELIDHREIVEGISTDRIAQLLPRKRLHEIMAATFAASQSGKPFSEKDMLDITPPSALVESIPLQDLWQKVIAPQVAKRHKLSAYAPPKPPPVAGAGGKEDEDEDLDMDIDDVLDMSADVEDDKKTNGKSVNPPAS
ncbi:MAG: hypothetical protein AAGE52_15190 [Myxococcota bacterium]